MSGFVGGWVCVCVALHSIDRGREPKWEMRHEVYGPGIGSAKVDISLGCI